MANWVHNNYQNLMLIINPREFHADYECDFTEDSSVKLAFFKKCF
jgi:hypothetical protein